MEWTALPADEHNNVEDIKAQLIDLGFPAYILNDLRAEDIAACSGALEVVVNETDLSLNDSERDTESADDAKDLRITGIRRKSF